MPNTVPYEVIAAPFTLWVAPVGTAFPLIAADPADPWVKVGTSGPLNYDGDAGVTIEHPQTINKWRSLGDAGSRKVFRSEEDMMVRMTLVDLTPEQYAIAINGNAVTEGVAGSRRLGLSRGFTVATNALLVRGNVSPLGAVGNMQYQVWRAAQSGSPTVVYKKADPAGLALEWSALVDPEQDPEEYFGVLIVADAAS